MSERLAGVDSYDLLGGMAPADLASQLRAIGVLKVGDPFPPSLCSGATNEWGTGLAALCNAAADELDRLAALAGAVTTGPSFTELRASLPSCDPHPERK